MTEGCEIYGTVDFSVLFANVQVEEGAQVRDSIIMPGAKICSGASVQYAIIAENTVIGSDAKVGERPENMEDKDAWGVAVVGAGLTVGKKAVVPPKAMISEDVKGGRK